jgi:hypothetical protein
MRVELENVQITSYQLGVLDNNASTDAFVFQPQGSLGDTDGRDFLLWRKHGGTADSEPAASDPSLLLPAVTDPGLLLPYTDFHIV